MHEALGGTWCGQKNCWSHVKMNEGANGETKASASVCVQMQGHARTSAKAFEVQAAYDRYEKYKAGQRRLLSKLARTSWPAVHI